MNKQKTIEQLTQERDDALAKLRESEAKCSECLQLLNSINRFQHGIIPDGCYPHILHALSSDCGKGWKSPEEARALLDEIQMLRAANEAAVSQEQTSRVECNRLREAISRAADQIKRGEWNSHNSGTWQILNDALPK